jgi:hypothetical protein
MGLDLRPYTFAEVEEFAARLREVSWEKGLDATLETQPEDVQRYVLNELALSQCDWRYWSERYCKVVDDRGHTVPVRLWPSQERIFNMVAQQEYEHWGQTEKGKEMVAKIAIIIAKARQLGLTVIGEDLVAHLVLLFKNTRSIIASDDIRTNSPKLYRVFSTIYDNLPGWMQPPSESRVKATNMHFGHINSDLVVGGGNQKNTLGQGMTIDAVHLTEMSTWRDDVARAIEEDLKPAFRSSKKHHSIFIMESTGKGGKGNYFFDQWDAACRGLGMFKPIFIGWHSCPEKYSLKSDIEIRPDIQALARRIEDEQGTKLSRDQLAWYQTERMAAEATGDLQIFLQEYPSSADEAFQFGVRSVFPIEVRNRVRNSCRTPLAVFDVDWNAKKLVRIDTLNWIQSPDPDKAANRLILWEQARAGYTYVVGVDVSYGHEGQDNSAIQVVRVGNRWEKDEQVAEWSGNVDPAQLDTVAWMLGHMYTDRIEGWPAKMAIESNEGSPGILVQSRLKDRGYSNFYIMKRPNRIGGGWTGIMGWQTTPGTRDPLIMEGIDAIKRDILQINSPFTVEEMSTFVVKMTESGTRKIEHADRCHDDRLMALFIAFKVAHEGENRAVAEERAIRLEQMKAPTPRKIVSFQQMPISADQVNDYWEENIGQEW